MDLVVFTDLDGTLLDHHTYSFEPAMPALGLLKDHKIPVVLVSSKTFSEIRDYQQKLGIEDYPFVVENGSAIYTRPEYFPAAVRFNPAGDLWEYRLGRPYEELVNFLNRISEQYQYTIKGFHNTSASEIVASTGLSRDQVRMACTRAFSVPLFYDQRAQEILTRETARNDLHLLSGGRFMHLLGGVDKGGALNIIMHGYHTKFPGRHFRSVALGDSLNDFAMLRAADLPVLVRKHDGTYEQREKIPDVIISLGSGPRGWNTAVLNIIKN